MRYNSIQATTAQFSKEEKRLLARRPSFGRIKSSSFASSEYAAQYAKEEEKAIQAIAEVSLLLDTSDGVIVDAKYQLLGFEESIVIFECCIALLVRKNYDQARRLGSAALKKAMKDKGLKSRELNASTINLFISLIGAALETCDDIPLPAKYTPPSPFSALDSESPQYPNFFEITYEQQIEILTATIDEDVTPFVELDAGGVSISSIQEQVVVIKYTGSCTSCYAATGSTLSAIQSILRAKVNKHIVVEADPASLTFS